VLYGHGNLFQLWGISRTPSLRKNKTQVNPTLVVTLDSLVAWYYQWFLACIMSPYKTEQQVKQQVCKVSLADSIAYCPSTDKASANQAI